MIKIALASGKGGTGKTTLATGLALVLASRDYCVAYWDCDVEAPDGQLFLHPEWDREKTAGLPVPVVDESRCSGCGLCGEVCQFHALMVFEGKVTVFPDLCHGCGSCGLVCPEEAIQEQFRPLGQLMSGRTASGIDFSQGLLDIGQPLAVPVISQLKGWQVEKSWDVVIIDAPPGASCPVVEAVHGSDFVVLVTEPTPFGLHDLKNAYQVTRSLGIPAGVVINRAGIGDDGVQTYCHKQDLDILAQFPYRSEVARGLAQGRTLVEIDDSYQDQLLDLFHRINSVLSHKVRA